MYAVGLGHLEDFKEDQPSIPGLLLLAFLIGHRAPGGIQSPWNNSDVLKGGQAILRTGGAQGPCWSLRLTAQ